MSHPRTATSRPGQQQQRRRRGGQKVATTPKAPSASAGVSSKRSPLGFLSTKSPGVHLTEKSLGSSQRKSPGSLSAKSPGSLSTEIPLGSPLAESPRVPLSEVPWGPSQPNPLGSISPKSLGSPVSQNPSQIASKGPCITRNPPGSPSEAKSPRVFLSAKSPTVSLLQPNPRKVPLSAKNPPQGPLSGLPKGPSQLGLRSSSANPGSLSAKSPPPRPACRDNGERDFTGAGGVRELLRGRGRGRRRGRHESRQWAPESLSDIRAQSGSRARKDLL
nr:probable GPI-anchored adhesin-like protein PGA18 [Penaeus vannamei]